VSIEQVLAAHLPRDRYDAVGVHAGTYCTCGGWEGGYFADGEAGPFDGHLAAAIREWLLSDAVVERAANALAERNYAASTYNFHRADARAALTGATEEDACDGA
jgi:hypothetical protein